MNYVFTIQVDGEITSVYTFTTLDAAKKYMVKAIFLSENESCTFTEKMIQKEMKNDLPCIQDGLCHPNGNGLWIYKIHETKLDMNNDTDSEDDGNASKISLKNGKTTFSIDDDEVVIENDDEAISFEFGDTKKWKNFIASVVETGKGSFSKYNNEKIKFSGDKVTITTSDNKDSSTQYIFSFCAKKGDMKKMLQEVIDQ